MAKTPEYTPGEAVITEEEIAEMERELAGLTPEQETRGKQILAEMRRIPICNYSL